MSIEEFKTRPWPLVAMDLMQTLFDGDSQMADQILAGFAQSLPNRIKALRLQAYLGDVSVAMDDASEAHIRQLTEAGVKLVKANEATLATIAQQLSGR